MREISIHVHKPEYELGETIEGYVVIDCDESFDCNRVVIRFKCTERTRVVRGSGKHRRVYIEERVHRNEVLILKEFPIFQEGETGLDFEFEVPREIPASYEGVHGYIRYELMAKIELSWRLDPKDRKKIRVKHVAVGNLLDSKPVTSFADDDGINLLAVEALDDVIALGSDIPFTIRVDREANVRGVRAELIRKEHVAPKGKKEISNEVMCERYIDNEALQKDSWIEMEFKTNPAWTPTFKTTLIKSYYVLKVTLDIPWRFDKSVEIPITLHPPIHKFRVEEDTFGFEFD